MSAAPSLLTAGAPILDVERAWRQAAEAALTLGEHPWLGTLCGRTRAALPNHIEARYYQARLAMNGGDWRRAEPLLVGVLAADPEHWAARWSLGALRIERGETSAGLLRCREAVGQGGREIERALSATLPPSVLRAAPRVPQRPAEVQARWEEALTRLENHLDDQAVFSASDDLEHRLLLEVMRLVRLWRGRAGPSALQLARRLVNRHPRLVAARMILAESHASAGRVAESVALLHDARVLDPGGRVAARLRAPMLTMAFSSPLPAPITDCLDQAPAAVRTAVSQGIAEPGPAALRLAALRAKKPGAPAATGTSDVLRQIQRELAQLQVQVERKRPAETRTDLATAELVLTAKGPLVELYGQEGAGKVLSALERLVAVKQAAGLCRTKLLIVDDEASTTPWKLPAGRAVNAGQIKGMLDEVERRMEQAGERLAYLMLVGGHDLLPHHRLPNPVDDHDMDVPSDNPYAARGDNYLIPTRAVGRLPHERANPQLLLDQIARLCAAWDEQRQQSKGLLDGWMGRWLGVLPGNRTLPKGDSWGLTAEVWEKAAAAVFRSLDRDTPLLTFPPATREHWRENPFQATPFLYFNLHGVEESASWYGQAAPTRTDGKEPFPVALSPEHLSGRDLEGVVFFTEACYGVNPHAVAAADSIALTAVREGAALVVGATKTAYASFAPPLMAADLLAALFWRAIAGGAPGGLALQTAKVQLAEHTMRRAGYLDVEEQKTLTSFILYGDPALPLLHRPRNADPNALRHLAAKTRRKGIYQIGAKGAPRDALSPALVDRVQQFAAPYLQGVPGPLTVRSHPVTLTDTPPPLIGTHAAASNAKRMPRGGSRWHVTLARNTKERGVNHRQIVTLTVDRYGKVLRSHRSR